VNKANDERSKCAAMISEMEAEQRELDK